jgi:glycine cleavage system H protein
MAWNTPADLKYTKSDEWLRIEGRIGTLGVTDYAQDQLNDVVYVDLPDLGAEVKKGESFATVESVKAASEINAPVSGKIVEVNHALEDEAELINTDPFGKGWIVKIELANPADADDLMDAKAYAEYCETRS